MSFKGGYLIVFLWLGFMYACDPGRFRFSNEPEEEILAKVGDKTLLLGDVQDLHFPPGKTDSLRFLRTVVDSWVREQLLLQNAERYLSDDMKDFEKQLNDYRNSLLIHTYRERLLATRLDTQVSAAEIEAYYLENQEDFLLKYNIVQYDCIIFPKGHKDERKVRQWMQNPRGRDEEKLNDFCIRYAYYCRFNDSTWVRMEELEKEIPLQYQNQEWFLQRNKWVEASDSVKTYFLHIHNYRKRETLSPLPFAAENIRLILLNQRKQQILKQLEIDIYNEAATNGTFEIYLD